MENLEDLGFVGFGIRRDAFPRHRRPRYIATTRVPNKARHVSDEKDHGMAEILEVLHLPKQHSMTEMKIRRRRIETGLYTKWFASLQRGGQALFQILFPNEFGKTFLQVSELLIDRKKRHVRYQL